MSEDPIGAADLGDAGSRGERRRALRAERERQAERQAQREQPAREQPPELPLLHPYADTLQGREAAVLVADSPDAPDGEDAAGGSAPDAGGPVPPSAAAPAEPATVHPQDAGAPPLFASGAEARSLFTENTERDGASPSGADEHVSLPPARRPRGGPLPFDLPPFALPSDPQPSEWSAFTPVIPPEPLSFDERRPAAWAPRETWTPSDTTLSDSWMAVSPAPKPTPSPESVGPGGEVSARTPDGNAWTVPTPEEGVPVERPEPQERVGEWSPQSPAGVAKGPEALAADVADVEDVPPVSPPAWSADLSRVELFRSALEDLAQGPGDSSAEPSAHESSADELRADHVPTPVPSADEPPGREGLAHELPGDELPLDDLPVAELPVDELPVDELPVDELPTGELATGEFSTGDLSTGDLSTGDLSTGDLSTGGSSTGEASTDELPATVLDVPRSSDELSGNERQRNEPSWDQPSWAEESGTERAASHDLPSDELPSDELPSHELPSDEWPSDELPSDELPSDELPSDDESLRGQLADAQSTDGPQPQVFVDHEGDEEVAVQPLSLSGPKAEPLAGRPERRPPDDDERLDGPLPALGLPPVASAPAPPPAPPAAPPRPEDTHLPPLGRQAFGRAPTQRLAEALAHGEGPHPSEDDEPVRGTVAPVLRRSTERVRYPTSTMPVIRPPVMPPTPGSGIPIAPSRGSAVPWQQALSGDVVPQAKKKPPRRSRVSKPRHESGGVGEYRPKVAADRSLTLLVVAMLLVLAGLVAAAVWTFWPTVSGSARSLPPSGAPGAVGGP